MTRSEPRFKTAVITVGGVNPEFEFLPEIDPMNYLSRVTTPVLMLNGELDNVVPLEAAARPFFEQLATPAADKKQVSSAARFEWPKSPGYPASSSSCSRA